MPHSMTCPSCHAQLMLPDHALGKVLKCPRCATQIAVRAGAPHSPPAVVAPVMVASPPPPPPPPRQIPLKYVVVGGGAIVVGSLVICAVAVGWAVSRQPYPTPTPTPAPQPSSVPDVVFTKAAPPAQPSAPTPPPEEPVYKSNPILLPPVSQEPDPDTVERVKTFLSSPDRGRFIVNYAHFGTAYRGHDYLRTRVVVDQNQQKIPRQFALVYKFYWADDGWTELGFLCSEDGSLYKVQLIGTNAQLSQPFLSANLTIATLGKVILEGFKDKLTAEQQQDIQRAIQQGDAKTLLERALNLQLKLGAL